MKSFTSIAIIVVSAIVVIVAIGTGAFLIMNASSGRDAQDSPSRSERRQERLEAPSSGEESVSLKLSAGESGTLEHDSGARMEIPDGALLGGASVSITVVDPPPSSVDVGRVYDFSVGDYPVLAPVTLHMPFELEAGADDSQIVPLHWDEDLEVWIALEGEVDSAARTVAVTVSDLSKFSTTGGRVTSGSQTHPSARARIVKVEVPETVLVNETLNVDWYVQNEGPSNLAEVDKDAVGYVLLTSPGPQVEKFRLRASHGLFGWSRDWKSGVVYSWKKQTLGEDDRQFTITPEEPGPITVRVELVFENGNGEVIDRAAFEREVHVTTQRGISPTTVVVKGREYEVSGKSDTENGIDYVVLDTRDSSHVEGSLKDKAVFTAYLQQTFRTTRAKRAARFSWLIDTGARAYHAGADISTSLPTVLRAYKDIGLILMAPTINAKIDAGVSLGSLALTEIVKEIADHPEKFTKHTALQAMENNRVFIKDTFDLTKEVQEGRSLSFEEALDLRNWRAYGLTHYRPAHDAVLLIAVSKFSEDAKAVLKEVAAQQVGQVTGLPTSAVVQTEEILAVLSELREPLSEYGPWSSMQDGILANISSERADHAELLDSLGITDHEPFQLPILTTFQIADPIVADHDGGPAEPEVSTSVGRIAFTSDRDGDWDIYVMDADGSNVTQLTHNDAPDTEPSWSPDGERIAFTSTRDGDWDIYLMNADGSNVTQLTDSSLGDGLAVWSPAGHRIAFASNRGGNWDIYVIDADGSNQLRLTDHAANDSYPSWSPDGRRIAFVSDRDGNVEIYVMDADGTNVTRLTDGKIGNLPSWAPGHRIGFLSDRDGNAEIYAMDADGTNVTRLTNSVASEEHTAWSPDGSRIAFTSDRGGNWDIYVMDADGTDVTRLTDHPGSEWMPSWGTTTSRTANASSAPPSVSLPSRYLELLGTIPDSPETRRGVWITDYSKVRETFGLVLTGPDDEDLQKMLSDFREGRRDSRPFVKSMAFLGPLNIYFREVNQNLRYVALDHSDMDQSIVTVIPPDVKEVVMGHFDQQRTHDALMSCFECPPADIEEHRGVQFYSWGADFAASPRLSFQPPMFDHIGRGGRIAVLDSLVFRTISTEAMKSVIETSQNEVSSLADVQVFRLLADGMSSLEAYNMLLSEDVDLWSAVAHFREYNYLYPQYDHHGDPLAGTGPWLSPFEAYALGVGADESGNFMALVLLHANGDDAAKNVGLLRRVIEEEDSVLNESSWSEIIDLERSEILADGRVLLAKVRAANPRDSLRILGGLYDSADSLILHE